MKCVLQYTSFHIIHIRIYDKSVRETFFSKILIHIYERIDGRMNTFILAFVQVPYKLKTVLRKSLGRTQTYILWRRWRAYIVHCTDMKSYYLLFPLKAPSTWKIIFLNDSVFLLDFFIKEIRKKNLKKIFCCNLESDYQLPN